MLFEEDKFCIHLPSRGNAGEGLWFGVPPFKLYDYLKSLACFCQVTNRKYPKLKEVDDVLGGAAAWENVDSTAGGKFSITKPVTQPCLLLLIIFNNNAFIIIQSFILLGPMTWFSR